MKKCTKCYQVKSFEEFYSKKGRLGWDSWCKECYRKYAENYREKYPERAKESIDKYLNNNRAIVRERGRQWRIDNPEKSRLASHKWYKHTKNAVTECILVRVKESLRSFVRRRDLWKILSYTCEDFMRHIENQFGDGMSWDNHGEWEFDHIIPISFFHFQSPKDVEFKMCWRLENIQPLWKHQHKQKAAKILMA